MERLGVMETKKAGEGEKPEIETSKPETEDGHFEAVAFFERHRDFLEHYAWGRVRIEPAPQGVNTFAFNLETNTIYVNSMFYKKGKFSDEKTLFAICHEIEHFLEKMAMLNEEGGERNFGNYLARIGKSRAFALLDSCNGDIRENRAVVSRTNIGMREVEGKMYKEDLFQKSDFTQKPKHIQFCQTLLREARVPDEQCSVSPEVRQALDEVGKVNGLMDIMTNPQTPMSTRLKLQEKFLWPKVEALLEKDLEEKKKQQEQEKKEKGEGEKKQEGTEQPNEDRPKEGENRSDEGGKKAENEGNIPGKNETSEETDPNIIFASEYDKAEKAFPEAVPFEDIKKAFKKWQEAQQGKDEADQADEDYAKKIGVEKKDLQEYRKTVENLEKMSNPETNVGVLEELRNLFARIISKRFKKAQVPKYPVEEGDEIVDPAQLVAEVKLGNLYPKVWEDTEIKEKSGDKFGEVEITLVCDRSSSMFEGQKAIEQRRSAVLIMEVLKEFAQLCEQERINLDHPLEVRSEIYGFGAGEDEKPMKIMSTELGEAERINVFKQLHNLPGKTTDFNCLETIWEKMDKDVKMKIRSGELKKILFILTDGASDDSARVQAVLKNLKNDGLVVVGVGITEEGNAVLTTYAPDAQVVEDVSKLPVAIGNLLKEHLKDI